MSRLGNQTFLFDRPPHIAAHISIAGPKESEGPLSEWFDLRLEDDLLGQSSWELAESEMVRRAAAEALRAGKLPCPDVQAMLGGDLTNQIIAASFAARTLGIPFLGMYGACSTFTESLIVASALISGGYLDNALCTASSHYCTAERQFRFPVELGNQRPPQASRTVTACGCALLERDAPPDGLRITSGTVGRVIDLEIKDANHMGAAMAPAVCSCIEAHLNDTGRSARDYDLIATGDLGWIGRNILMELFRADGLSIPDDLLIDCGGSIFSQEQDAHAGGSGCGCVASVSCGWLMKRMKRGELRRILLIGSGAMFSPTSSQQGQSIPGIAYAVCMEGGAR